MNNDVMFSSKNQAWETRWEDFNKFNDRFGFDLDVCASEGSQKCERYFTPEDNGLSQVWDGTFWCNPPYGREYPEWVKYAIYQSLTKRINGVILIPARTDTILFHNTIMRSKKMRYLDVEFLRGRLVFGSDEYWAWVWEQEILNDKKNSLYKKYGKMNPAPFPSMLLKFGDCINK